MKTKTLLFWLIIIECSSIFAVSYHVQVNGHSAGNGTITSPWDLQTALNHPIKVVGGDTIWLHGGTYRGAFISRLKGRSNAPVFVRAIPGDSVVIDGNIGGDGNASLSIEGEYTWYWGLIITNTHGDRTESSPSTMDYKDGVYFVGANNKLINCIIHNNGGNGVGFWNPAVNSEIYGCIIYNNGYIGEDRGHGHGIYSQNETGTKKIRDNIIFNSFGLGIHIYTEGGSIKGYNIEGNILFNNGLPGNDFLERNIIVGGMKPAERIVIKSNYLYNRPDYPSKGGIQLGYGDVANVNADVQNNYIVNCPFSVVNSWNYLKFTNNLVSSSVASNRLISFDNFQNVKIPEFNNNNYYNGNLSSLSFDDWKNSSGQDNSSTYSTSVPKETYYLLKQNLYEDGRATLVVYNWQNKSSVGVDLSKFLAKDSEYKIYDVQNFSSGPLFTGTYNGAIVDFPMNLTQVELPYGNLPYNNKFIHTSPDFGVFLITGRAIQDGSVKPDEEGYSSSPLKIISFYPNPTVDVLAVDFYSPDDNRVTIEVVDNSGRIISSEPFYPKEGNNKYVTNLAEYPPGIYMIQFSSRANKVSCKVIKTDYSLKSETVSDIKLHWCPVKICKIV